MDFPSAQAKVLSLRNASGVGGAELRLAEVKEGEDDVEVETDDHGTEMRVLAPNPATRFRSSSLKKVPTGAPSHALSATRSSASGKVESMIP